MLARWRIRRPVVFALVATAGLLTIAAESIQQLLDKSIIGPDLAWQEVQVFTENRVPPVPDAASAAAWEKLTEQLRRDTLNKVVFRGEAAQWRKIETKVTWGETLEGGPGYHLRKLRYEAVPGLWIPGILYEPNNLNGRVPVMLAVNGHEGVGKSVPYKQLRCINLAKRGMIVLNLEWIGMGQLNGPEYQHYRMNQLDLCGTSGLAPFYLSMQRGLDILLAHQNADPKRVSVSGLSGGGWQTIFISSLDPRVTLSNPVAGYSSFKTRARFVSDLGDSEQTPSDLATVVDYATLTAMRAPRPTLLTFNARDNCCFGSDHALEPLIQAAMPKFALFGKTNLLRYHINDDPGDHNYGLDNRQAFYKAVGDFFYTGATFDPKEIPSEGGVKTAEQFKVELPSNNETFNSIALKLSANLPANSTLPQSRERSSWTKSSREKLSAIIKAKEYSVTAQQIENVVTPESQAIAWKFKVGQDWTVPGIEFKSPDPKGLTILVADNGRKTTDELVRKLLSEKQSVLAIDPFYFGESKIKSRDFLYGLLVAAVGERSLGIQASQIAAIARWAHNRGHHVNLYAAGPRSSAFGLIAAALEESIQHTRLEGSLGSLKEVLESNWSVDQKPELFCFGLLKEFDLAQITALCAPRAVSIVKPSARAQKEFAVLRTWFEDNGGKFLTE